MKIQGKVIRYQDNVDTDVIIPARYLNTADAKELAAHCMEDLDATFIKRVQKGNIIVAGNNFGCGSSREHAPLAIKESGIACVVAKSFARIFYRNAINIGLPILECPAASEAIAEGDTVSIDFDTGVNIGLPIIECDTQIDEADTIEIDFDNGTLKNLTKNTEAAFAPFPPFLQNIISSGGLLSAINGGKL